MFFEGRFVMINEKFWNCVDEEKRDQLIHQYSARGIPVEFFNDHRIAINILDEIFELSFHESIIWYSCFFDSLDYDTLVSRFKDVYSLINGGFYLGDYHEDFYKALRRLKKDNLICCGNGENRYSALFNLFANGNIRLILNYDNGQYDYSNGVIINTDLINYSYAIQTHKKTLPISNEEKVLMDMLNSENWNIAEISRNFLRGFDSNVTRSQLSDDESKKLADIDFVRNSYECTPYTKMITLIALTLLRKHRIIIM